MTFSNDLLNRFQDLHTDLGKAIHDLPIEALDWVPGPEMNSIAGLVVHLIGAERYWIGDVALSDPSNRDREQEFRVMGLAAAELAQRLSAANEYLLVALTSSALPGLKTVCRSPRNDKIFSVGWSLLHALEHTALHTGHIQLTRQLWLMKEYINGKTLLSCSCHFVHQPDSLQSQSS